MKNDLNCVCCGEYCGESRVICGKCEAEGVSTYITALLDEIKKLKAQIKRLDNDTEYVRSMKGANW